jgi:hypothetical protein
MIGCAFGKRAVMGAAAFDINIMADDDAIEPRHRPSAVKTGGSLYQPMMVKGEFG